MNFNLPPVKLEKNKPLDDVKEDSTSKHTTNIETKISDVTSESDTDALTSKKISENAHKPPPTTDLQTHLNQISKNKNKKKAPSAAKTEYIKYEPSPNVIHTSISSKMIKIVERPVDPLAPSTVRRKRVAITAADREAAVPIERATPASATPAERRKWKIPACNSKWKSKGTQSLEQRSQHPQAKRQKAVSDKFADFAESLATAESTLREELKQKSEAKRKLPEINKNQL